MNGDSLSVLPRLQDTPFFARITSRADMAQLERRAVRRCVAPDENLILEGEPVDAVSLIRAGEVSVCFSGGSVESLRLGPGSLFGEMEFYQCSPGLATVMARLPTELICVSYDDLREVADDNPATGMQLYQGFLQTMVSKHQLVSHSLVDVKLDKSRQHLAHDLKSPLAALRYLAECAADSLPADDHEMLCQIVDRISGIVDSLRHGDSREEFSDAEESSLLTALQKLVGEKRVRLQGLPNVGVTALLPDSLESFDAGSCLSDLMRIVSNLLDNAIEAMADREGAITRRVWETPAMFGLEVHDEGKGMPNEFIARLGQQPLTHGKVGGQGLGLFHAHRVVNAWGGRMVVQSGPGKGSVVGFQLPAGRLMPGGEGAPLHANLGSIEKALALPQHERSSI